MKEIFRIFVLFILFSSCVRTEKVVHSPWDPPIETSIYYISPCLCKWIDESGDVHQVESGSSVRVYIRGYISKLDGATEIKNVEYGLMNENQDFSHTCSISGGYIQYVEFDDSNRGVILSGYDEYIFVVSVDTGNNKWNASLQVDKDKEKIINKLYSI